MVAVSFTTRSRPTGSRARRTALTLLVGLAGLPGVVAGQLVPQDTLGEPAAPSTIASSAGPGGQALEQQPRASDAALGMGGIIGGAAGFFGGGFVGYQLTNNGCSGSDLCGLPGAALGAALGELVGVAFGVHAANGRAGRFGSDLAASTLSALVAGAAATVVYNAAHAEGIELVLTPLVVLAQLAWTARSERRSSSPASPAR